MPDRRRRGRGRRAPLSLAALLLLGGVAAAWAPVALAIPGEGGECGGGTTASSEGGNCNGGTGGFNFGTLLPIAGAIIVIGLVAVGAGYFVVLRRRAAPPLIPEPSDAGEWWTCRECGRKNVVGSARCYGCGAWQR